MRITRATLYNHANLISSMEKYAYQNDLILMSTTSTMHICDKCDIFVYKNFSLVTPSSD